MSKYVDGFLLPLDPTRLDRYREIASEAGRIWKEHGALAYFECVGDDMRIENMVSFLDAAATRDNETAIFAWIVFESREHRDRVNAAVMADPRMNAMMGPDEDVFDCKRMAYGGFRVLVEA